VSPEEKKKQIIGKVAQKTVTTKDGFLIAAEGLYVNQTEVDIAERKGVLDELYQVTHKAPSAADLKEQMLESEESAS